MLGQAAKVEGGIGPFLALIVVHPGRRLVQSTYAEIAVLVSRKARTLYVFGNGTFRCSSESR